MLYIRLQYSAEANITKNKYILVDGSAPALVHSLNGKSRLRFFCVAPLGDMRDLGIYIKSVLFAFPSHLSSKLFISSSSPTPFALLHGSMAPPPPPRSPSTSQLHRWHPQILLPLCFFSLFPSTITSSHCLKHTWRLTLDHWSVSSIWEVLVGRSPGRTPGMYVWFKPSDQAPGRTGAVPIVTNIFVMLQVAAVTSRSVGRTRTLKRGHEGAGLPQR
jgi:hypothetical protein